MRLIDADMMNEELFYKELGGKDSLITAECVFDMLKAQPTAYDVEKVMEQLEDASVGTSGVAIITLPTIIEIVRKGGVE